MNQCLHCLQPISGCPISLRIRPRTALYFTKMDRLAVLQRHILPDQPRPLLSKQDTCGIVAYVGKSAAVNLLLDGLTILQSRGYVVYRPLLSCCIALFPDACRSLCASAAGARFFD